MMKILILKEMQQGIISLRYMLTLVLTIIIFSTSAVLFIKKYENRRMDYEEQQLENRENLEERAQHLNQLSRRGQYLIRPPRLSELFATGEEKHLPDRIEFTSFRYAGYENIDRLNYMLNPFTEMDWVFIVGLILSFAALVLTFDQISGEREHGTLKLQCSNSVSRFTMIMAKYLASLMLMAFALFIGIIINLIIISIGLNASLVSLYIVQIFISIMLFLFYLSLFLLLGLFISSQVRKSSSSLAISLLIWTTIVIFVPAGGSMLGQKLRKIPSSYEYTQKRDAAWNEIWSNAPVPQARGYWNGRDFPYLADRVKLVNILDESNDKFRAERFRELLSQVQLARNLTLLSPYSLLRYAMESIAETGLDAFIRYYEQGKVYRMIFREFITRKDAQDPDSYHQMCSWIPEAYSDKPVSIEDIPEFTEPRFPPGETLWRVKINLLLLTCFNLLGALLAFGAFMRYDVR